MPNSMNPNKFQVPDLVAIITLIGCLVLIGLGANGTVSAVLIGIVSFYFGNRFVSGLKVKEPTSKQPPVE